MVMSCLHVPFLVLAYSVEVRTFLHYIIEIFTHSKLMKRSVQKLTANFESWLGIVQLMYFMCQLDYPTTGAVHKTT